MMVAQLTCIESLRESYRTLWTDLLPEDPADGKADADGKAGAP